MNLYTEISLSLLQIEQLYRQKLPDIVCLATMSSTSESFKNRLLSYINEQKDVDLQAKAQIKRFIEFDGQCIDELSTGCKLHISTLNMLHAFLNGKNEIDMEADFLLDLFHQFRRLYASDADVPSAAQIQKATDRWSSGLDEDVLEIRNENKERVLHKLIQKISRKKDNSSRYAFAPSFSYEEKYKLVKEWWNDYRFQLSMAIRDPEELNAFLGDSLSDETMFLLTSARKKGIPFFITPYYLSLLNCTSEGYDDRTLRSYIIYSPQLVKTFGEIHAWEKEDIVENEKPNAAGWLLPNGPNIHRRYPEVAILIPDTTGRACGGLCASCQRMYDFQSKHFNFNLNELRPKKRWEEELHDLLTYFENDTQLRDILITGGDALMSTNKILRIILDAVYEMALRKQSANAKRPEGAKYAEIQRIRLGTRLPVYLPMRIDDELVDILRQFKEKATKIGIQQFIIQTHFETPLEITPDAAEGIRKLLSSGWLVDNQLVYNVAASRRGHTTRLRQELNRIGILCYYTFTVKGFEENYAVFAPNARSVQEQFEEKRIGTLTDDAASQLAEQLKHTTDIAACIRTFMESRNLPFLATDRNVLNLPAIGKSMTFETVGITAQGKRILLFSHDHTRRHSPIIDQLGKVFIVENKSIASYLRQLNNMKEDINDYASIWKYTEGKTEPRFALYEYPNFDFQITNQLTNLIIPDN